MKHTFVGESIFRILFMCMGIFAYMSNTVSNPLEMESVVNLHVGLGIESSLGTASAEPSLLPRKKHLKNLVKPA